MRVLLAAILLTAGAARAGDLPPSLDQLVSAARADGLPADAVESKALEGLAKGVPEVRIAAVLQGMVDELGRARGALPDGSADAIVAGARALHAGATADSVVLVGAAPGALSARSLHALADLMALGVPEADAVRAVRAAAVTGNPDRDLTGLAVTTAAMVARGASIEAAAAEIVAGLAVQHAGVVSLPESGPGHSDPRGNAFGHDKDPPGQGHGPNR